MKESEIVGETENKKKAISKWIKLERDRDVGKRGWWDGDKKKKMETSFRERCQVLKCKLSEEMRKRFRFGLQSGLKVV